LLIFKSAKSHAIAGVEEGMVGWQAVAGPLVTSGWLLILRWTKTTCWVRTCLICLKFGVKSMKIFPPSRVFFC